MTIIQRFLDHAKPYPLLVIPLVLGVSLLLLLASGLLGSDTVWKRLLENIGIALVTAFVIGAAIDLVLRTRISQDVFRAAFGYLFPAPIREEIHGIYELKLIAEEYEHEYEIMPLSVDPTKVVVRETITRVVKSLTGKEETFTPSLGIQEWFHADKPPTILSADCNLGNEHWGLSNGDYTCDTDFRDYPILKVELNKAITVTDRRKAVLIWQYEEVRDWNDQSYSYFTLPAQRSNVNVTVPDELGFDVTFANRNQGELKLVSPGRYRLDAVLLPDQAIRLRWWKKADMENWVQANKATDAEETAKDRTQES